MKKLTIPRINSDTTDIRSVADQLANVSPTPIDVINWLAEYPSKPEVSFRIAHNGDNILLQYQVHENEILGVITEDNGEVWTDSCVEFFITFDNDSYYNIEATCTGKVLLGYRKTGVPAEHGSEEIMGSIQRLSSLGTQVIQKKQGDFHWSLTLVIPKEAFWKTDLKSFDGLKVRGNFYKCGDNLTVPHFVAWTEIDTPSPSFHQPGYFGELVFE